MVPWLSIAFVIVAAARLSVPVLVSAPEFVQLTEFVAGGVNEPPLIVKLPVPANEPPPRSKVPPMSSVPLLESVPPFRLRATPAGSSVPAVQCETTRLQGQRTVRQRQVIESEVQAIDRTVAGSRELEAAATGKRKIAGADAIAAHRTIDPAEGPVVRSSTAPAGILICPPS